VKRHAEKIKRDEIRSPCRPDDSRLRQRLQAKRYVDKLLALEPNFTVERFGHVYPIKYEGDRLAGVPER
jgi:hypothetical protein